MIWNDVLIETKLSEKQIRKAFAEIFKVPWERCTVVMNVEDFPELGHFLIVCHKSAFKGPFWIHIGIYLFDRALENAPSIDDFAFQLASIENTRCLIPSESLNPVEYILYNKEGVKRIAYIDADLMDEDVVELT